jgi:lipid II:glycine glycyltransferase (peptidoglycan interpeptide bridge formation enzyme)
MNIKELTIQAFELYTENSPLKNYMQSAEYARIMGENHYNYDYIGLVDESGSIKAASLILWKKIGFNMRYGYAPKGFLLNYYDEALVKTFVSKLKEYYSKKNFAFIKINPEIVVGEIDYKTHEFRDNPNMRLKQDLQRFGFVKLKDNLYFESMEPRFNAYIDLKNTDLKNYSKANRNKVRNSKRKGLYLEKGDSSDIDTIYKLLDTDKPISYYKNLYNIFSQKDMIDLLLVKVDYENFIKNSQDLYDRELNNNSLYNEILHRSHKPADLNKKMASDSKLCIIKNEIVMATEGLRNHNDIIVACAFVIKYDSRAHIVESAFDRNYAKLNPNYFLYDAIINNYKFDYDYLDLNGVTGDFKKTNPYRGLNNFKLGFAPKIYEYIGEFDLIINESSYNYLLSSGKLAGEFNKK